MTSYGFHSKMAGFRDRDKQHFPLRNIEDVVDLFKDQLQHNDEPNLALLSIVLGVIENNLTVNRAIPANFVDEPCVQPLFPVLQLSTVEALYHRFVCLIRGSIDLTVFDSQYATRELVKRVSDVVWAGLSRGSYKDKAHLQTLYSYLTGNKLDCFGLALAVVAACQQLGFNDVHMALSEDHAWVVFGPDGTDTSEVTWHGKGNEDKRGQPITLTTVDKSWLYLHGHPVICSRHMEVAAMVSSINPAINATMDSVEMGALQQDLLWLLYDMGDLDKYPMALGNLGDLEEIAPTHNRPAPVRLFHKAIQSTRQFYNNQHVYPYTYLGGYYYRKGMFKEAIRYWAGAAQAISRYNYNREDEEIYKEFLEIANELIPHIIKVCVDHQHSLNNSVDLSPAESQPRPERQLPLLQDPEVYTLLLRFYDGICEWEEGSSTPVLHITWANHLFHSLSKFEGQTREGVEVEEDEEDGANGDGAEEKVDGEEGGKRARRDRRECSKENRDSSNVAPGDRKRKRSSVSESSGTGVSESAKTAVGKGEGDGKDSKPPQKNGRKVVSEEEKIKTTIEELASKVGEDSQNETPNPNIADLAKACGEGILNPDYLLGVGEPFTTSTSTSIFTAATDTKVDFNEFLSSQSDGSAFPGISMDTILRADSPMAADMMLTKSAEPRVSCQEAESVNVELFAGAGKLALRSAKMKGMKRLLLANKLNSNAIKLQLTAQSQVHLKHSTTSSEYGRGGRKRTRRE